MERKRARSDDSDESFVRGVSPDAGLPACVSSDTLHVVGGNNTPPSPPRALHGPVVSTADLPDLAKRRKVDEEEVTFVKSTPPARPVHDVDADEALARKLHEQINGEVVARPSL